MERIKLAEVRRLMRQTRVERGEEKPVPFSLEFVTCDESKGTGGEFRRLANACLAKMAPQVPKSAAGPREDRAKVPFLKIFDMDQNRVINVHIRLITKFNNLEVQW